MKKKIYIEGEGCDRRLLEKSKILKYLEKNDYKFTSLPSKADYLLLFTCAFKKEEEDYSLGRLQALQNYRGRLLVYGCLPDIAPQRVGYFDLFCKLAPKDLDQIDDFFDGITVKYADITDPHAIANSPKAAFVQKVRRNLYNHDFLLNRIFQFRELFLKSKKYYYLMVCRGCLGVCSYCAIRRAVGSVISKPISVILAEFRKGLEAGYQDFVLLGDDLGSYGLDGPGTLPILVQYLLGEIKLFRDSEPRSTAKDPVVRFHLKEVHPKYLLQFEEYLSQIFENQTVISLLCPIQSGSPSVLDLMHREHTVDGVKRIIGKIRKLNPVIELSTQIIIGFPTESEEDFEATLALVVDLKFSWVVVFPFDPKKGTPAAEMAGKVSTSIIRKRVRTALKYFRHHGIRAFTNCPL